MYEIREGVREREREVIGKSKRYEGNLAMWKGKQ